MHGVSPLSGGVLPAGKNSHAIGGLSWEFLTLLEQPWVTVLNLCENDTRNESFILAHGFKGSSHPGVMLRQNVMVDRKQGENI